MGISTPKYIFYVTYRAVINSILDEKFGYVVGNNINDMASLAYNLMEHHPAYYLTRQMVQINARNIMKIYPIV